MNFTDGNLFILIGSHIGISESFNLGKFSRMGQERDGTACGAAVGALNFCCDANNKMPSMEELGECPEDYQMKYLISQLAQRWKLSTLHRMRIPGRQS